MAFLLRLVTCGVLAVALGGCAIDWQKNATLSSLLGNYGKIEPCGVAQRHKDHVAITPIESAHGCLTLKFIEHFVPQIRSNGLAFITNRLTGKGFSCGQQTEIEPESKAVTCRFLHHWLRPSSSFAQYDAGYWDWTIIAAKHETDPIQIEITVTNLGYEKPAPKISK